MPLYCMLFRATPTAAAPGTEDVAGASVTMWTLASDPDAADIKAREAIMAQGWLVEECEVVLAPDDEQIAHLDADMQLLAGQARRFGHAMFFAAWPKEERPEDAPWELRRLRKPHNPGSEN